MNDLLELDHAIWCKAHPLAADFITALKDSPCGMGDKIGLG